MNGAPEAAESSKRLFVLPCLVFIEAVLQSSAFLRTVGIEQALILVIGIFLKSLISQLDETVSLR